MSDLQEALENAVAECRARMHNPLTTPGLPPDAARALIVHDLREPIASILHSRSPFKDVAELGINLGNGSRGFSPPLAAPWLIGQAVYAAMIAADERD
jgi:hypothetical protein